MKKERYRNSLFHRLFVSYLVAIVCPSLATAMAVVLVSWQLAVNVDVRSGENRLSAISAMLDSTIFSIETSSRNLAVDDHLQVCLNNHSKEPELRDKYQEQAAKALDNYIRYNTDRIRAVYLIGDCMDWKRFPCFLPLSALSADLRASFADSNRQGMWMLAQGEEIKKPLLRYVQPVDNNLGAPVFLVVDLEQALLEQPISGQINLGGVKLILRSPYDDGVPSGTLLMNQTDFSAPAFSNGRSGHLKKGNLLQFYDYVQHLDATLFYERKTSVVLSTLTLYGTMLAIVLTGVIGLAVYTYRLTWNIQRRIDRIVAAMQRVEQGDLSDYLQCDYQRDEISYISDSFNHLVRQLSRTVADLSRQEKLQVQTQLMALQNQLNPHFIYNTLEIFRMEMEITNVSEASDAIAAFGAMLRYNMNIEDNSSCLMEELEHASNYVQVMNLRYGGRIHLQIDCPDCWKKRKTPKFMIQPLVENAVKYNKIRLGSQPLEIFIQVTTKGQLLLIRVMDTGVGMTQKRQDEVTHRLREIQNGADSGFEPAQSHIGLCNIAQRLRIICGKEGHMTVESTMTGSTAQTADRQTVITIYLPSEREG